jgi:protein NrfD
MPEGIDPGRDPARWDGRTYYGRAQLKPAPFHNALVGSYVFLAGLSGGAQLLSALLDLARGRAAEPTVRRGRYLSLLAPTLGTACLISDLHTPQRFYNMLRVFKTTSPMSFGSWLLVAFGGFGTLSAAAQFLADRARGFGWLRGLARAIQVPAALAGAGIATYTASLFSASSTPRWAAAPCSLAMRYAAASVASAAAALGLGESRSATRRDLDAIAVAALAVELAAAISDEGSQQRAGIAEATNPHTLGIILPLGLFAVSLLWPGRRLRALSTIAGLGVLADSLAMRIRVLDEGDESARRPELSLRFAQPDNLPRND